LVNIKDLRLWYCHSHKYSNYQHGQYSVYKIFPLGNKVLVLEFLLINLEKLGFVDFHQEIYCERGDMDKVKKDI